MEKIIILGTGGTIAGSATSQTNLTGYKSGDITIEALLATVPELDTYGPIEGEQFCNIESSDMTADLWLSLAKRVQTLVEQEDVAAVVITHGTDSLEETAYFLQLAVATDKPIVMTGAMRPSTALSPDGPLNILQAVQVARTKEAAHKGVLIVMNGYIDSASFIQKTDTTHVETFASHPFGHCGVVQEGKAYFVQTLAKKRGIDFWQRGSILEVEKLPKVEVVYLYPDMDLALLSLFEKINTKAIVLAGLGHGTIPCHLWNTLKALSDKGIILVRASRTAMGLVTDLPGDKELGLIPAYGLSPFKVRMLLRLALTKKFTKEDIQQLLLNY